MIAKRFDQRRLLHLLIMPLIVVYLFYAVKYIQETSYVIAGERYYVLFDDVMISMRYAKNLAGGLGPVWNPGERVEGYSNPLWVGIMALIHLLPLPVSKISLGVQILGMLLLAANLWVVKKVADELVENPLVGLLAAGVTAFYVPLNNWGLQGMEVSLLVLMTGCAAWLAIRVVKTGLFTGWLYLFLGIATLVRIDMAVPFVTILGYLVWQDVPNRRRHLVWGLATLVVFLGGQTLLRLWYYGEIFPNTYYLKVTGLPLWFRAARGAYVYWQFLWTTNWFLYLLPVIFILTRRERFGVLLVGLFLAQSAYSIYVGGDAWEHRGGANRFIAIAMPMLFVAFFYTLEKVRAALTQGLPAWGQVSGYAGLLVVAGISLFSFSMMIDNNFMERFFLRRQPLFVRGTERVTMMGLALNQVTRPEARIAVVTAGAIPYFADRYAIDLMGKNDAVIAHSPHRVKFNRSGIRNFRSGHTKWDYAYSIAELEPDVVAQLWDETGEEALPYLLGVYRKFYIDEVPMYFRSDSPNIRWEVLQEAGVEASLDTGDSGDPGSISTDD